MIRSILLHTLFKNLFGGLTIVNKRLKTTIETSHILIYHGFELTNKVIITNYCLPNLFSF